MQTKYYILKKNCSIQSIKIFLKSQKQLPLHFSPITAIKLQYSNKYIYILLKYVKISLCIKIET